MYEIVCENCGKIGYHPSRVAAESKAETHKKDSEHTVRVTGMSDI